METIPYQRTPDRAGRFAVTITSHGNNICECHHLYFQSNSHGKWILSVLSLPWKSKSSKSDACVFQCISRDLKMNLSFDFCFSILFSINSSF